MQRLKTLTVLRSPLQSTTGETPSFPTIGYHLLCVAPYFEAPSYSKPRRRWYKPRADAEVAPGGHARPSQPPRSRAGGGATDQRGARGLGTQAEDGRVRRQE